MQALCSPHQMVLPLQKKPLWKKSKIS
jgi:hypothetical protein